jgi:hypothetical protein
VTFAQTSFASDGGPDARVAYIAAFVLTRYGIECSVATSLNVGELDEEVWNTPVGTYRCIIVGRAAFDLLSERSQEWVFFPPARRSLITGVRWVMTCRIPSPGWLMCCSASVRALGRSSGGVGQRHMMCSSDYGHGSCKWWGT